MANTWLEPPTYSYGEWATSRSSPGSRVAQLSGSLLESRQQAGLLRAAVEMKGKTLVVDPAPVFSEPPEQCWVCGVSVGEGSMQG